MEEFNGDLRDRHWCFICPSKFICDDPSVQISGTRGQQATPETLSQVQSTLSAMNIQPKSAVLENGSILVRLESSEQQLPAKEKSQALGNNYSVALNLAPATPQWLSDIGGSPMKRGLDLLGGVRFLMEVDMNTALAKQQDTLQDSLRSDFVKKNCNIKRSKKAKILQLRLNLPITIPPKSSAFSASLSPNA